jgi:hypothetical protein
LVICLKGGLSTNISPVQNYFIFSQYLPEDDDGIEEKPVIDTPGEFEPEENSGRTVGYGFVLAICGTFFVSFVV